MAKLPTFTDTIEAVAYARDRVRRFRDEKITFCGVELYWFDVSENQRFAREILKVIHQWPEGLMDIVNLARVGWRLADQVCRELILDYDHHNRPMPPPLRAYSMEITRRGGARPRSFPGKGKADHFLRDIAIITIVADVCGRFDLQPTRLRPSKIGQPSGCQVVALALQAERGAPGLTESAVATIWVRLNRVAFPNGIPRLRG